MRVYIHGRGRLEGKGMEEAGLWDAMIGTGKIGYLCLTACGLE